MNHCKTCLWWKPNRVPPVEDEETERMCWFHNEIRDDEDGCEHHVSSDSTEVNVPQHSPNGKMEFKNEKPVEGVEILIVTYRKDFPWLSYALKCIAKHAAGFQGVTVGIPHDDLDTLVEMKLMQPFGPRVIVRTYDEIPAKGFLNHEVMMGEAEKLVPAGTKYCMHMDADSMMKMPNCPQDYFLNDKPIYLWRTWESLSSPDPRDPTQKIVSDCVMWKAPTEAQLGYKSDSYTMCRHPTVFPLRFYPAYRSHVHHIHGVPFDQYIMSGTKNAHPQDRMDLTAMGQFAKTFMGDQFHWINVATEEYPADRMRSYWSHGGILPNIKTEIEGFLK